MDLKLSTRSHKDVLIIDVNGRITSGDAISSFREAIRDQVAKGKDKILLDMSDVTYMDSSGLGELVMALGTVTQMVCASCGATVFRNDSGGWNRCPQCKSAERKPWGQLRLAGVTGPVKDLLQFSKLHSVFQIHDSEADALRSFE